MAPFFLLFYFLALPQVATRGESQVNFSWRCHCVHWATLNLICTTDNSTCNIYFVPTSFGRGAF